MRLVATITLPRSHLCGPCQADDYADPGAPCYCSDTEETLEIIGDVTPPGDGNVHPASDFIRIVSVKEVASAVEWSAFDVRHLSGHERSAMEEALWLAFLDREHPKHAVASELSKVSDILCTSVKLAIEMGVPPKLLLETLESVRNLALGARRGAA